MSKTIWHNAMQHDMNFDRLILNYIIPINNYICLSFVTKVRMMTYRHKALAICSILIETKEISIVFEDKEQVLTPAYQLRGRYLFPQWFS